MAYRFCSTVLAILLWTVQSHQRNIGANGAVTSEVELCSKVGIDLLRDGGNAANAVSYLYRRNIAI
jgi:gamma-glutamyltranspeptidase